MYTSDVPVLGHYMTEGSEIPRGGNVVEVFMRDGEWFKWFYIAKTDHHCLNNIRHNVLCVSIQHWSLNRCDCNHITTVHCWQLMQEISWYMWWDSHIDFFADTISHHWTVGQSESKHSMASCPIMLFLLFPPQDSLHGATSGLTNVWVVWYLTLIICCWINSWNN